MNNKHARTNLIKNTTEVTAALVFMAVFALISKSTLAANITLICQGDGTCDMYPAPDTKLFDYSNMLPGDSVTNTLTIQNTDLKNACDMTMRVFKDTETPANFADSLWTVIKEAAVDFFGARDGIDKAANYKNIEDVYTLQTIHLGPLAANSTRVFDWTVTFAPQSGNDLQLALTKFDLKFNLTCKMCQKPCKHCFDFHKRCEKRDDHGGYDDCHKRGGRDDHEDDNKWSKGDHVKYTMEIRSGGKHYKDVRITDAPFHGCQYISGSWTAFSNKRGDLKLGGHMKEPRYGSPGVWEIGDLQPGEVITLAYEAEIIDENYTGDEADLAWASAVDPDDASLVFSNDDGESLLTSSTGGPETDNNAQTQNPLSGNTAANAGFMAKIIRFINASWSFISTKARSLL